MAVVETLNIKTSDREVERWSHRIHRADEFKRMFTRQEFWDDYRDMYRMVRFSNDTVVQSGMPFAYVRSMTPQIYLRNPKISITPTGHVTPEKIVKARVLQQIDNWLIKEMGLKSEYRKMIQDNFFCGFGAGIVGYDSFHGTSSKFMDESAQLSLTQYGKNGERIEFFTSIKSGMPWFKRIMPEDLLFPPRTSDQDSLEWFAYRVWRRLRDVKADPKYSNTDGLKPKTRTDPLNTSRLENNLSTGEFDTEDEWVELWHIHDARTGRVYTIADGHPKFLRNEVDELQIEGLPVDVLVFNDDPQYIYGVPDMRVLEPQILELNDTRTQAQKHRRINIAKFLYRRNVIGEEELRKLISDEVDAGVAVDSETTPLNEVVAPISPGVSGILQDLVIQADQIKGDAREAVGFSRNAAGEFVGKTHISAAETNRVSRALDVRLDDRRNILADSFERVMRKINQIIISRWTTDRIVSIVGPKGEVYNVVTKPSELVLEYSMNVTVYDAPPLDKETKMRMAVEAARAYAELNQGAVRQGAPIPMTLQEAVFRQFDELGINTDDLVDEIKQVNQQMFGQTPQTMTVDQLAGLLAEGGRPPEQ